MKTRTTTAIIASGASLLASLAIGKSSPDKPGKPPTVFWTAQPAINVAMTASPSRSHAYVVPDTVDRRNGLDAAAMSGMANHNAARPRNDRIWVAAPSWPEAKSPCQRGIPGLPQHPMTHRRSRGRGVWPSARTSVEQPFRRSDERRSLRGRRRRAARSARRIRTSPAPAAAATPTPAMLLSAKPTAFCLAGLAGCSGVG